MLKKHSPKKLTVFVAVAVVILLGIGWVAYRHHHHKVNKTATTADGQPVNLNPPTTQEKQESEDNKDAIVNDKSNNPPVTNSGKKSVSVVITAASTDQVTAYVTGVFEENGTCTATFTQGGTTVTRTSTGFENASYTQCAPINPTLPTGGSWSVTVTYSSSTAEGTSAAKGF